MRPSDCSMLSMRWRDYNGGSGRGFTRKFTDGTLWAERTDRPITPIVGDKLPLILSLMAGACGWLALAIPSGREAWDTSSYFTTFVPALVLFAGALGFLFPRRAWRWGLALFAGQAAAAVVLNPTGGLLPRSASSSSGSCLFQRSSAPRSARSSVAASSGVSNCTTCPEASVPATSGERARN